MTFSWTGVENVMQTYEDWSPIPGGISSGNPTSGGSYTQVFGTNGTFHFRTTFLPPEDEISSVLGLLESFHSRFMAEHGAA